MTSQAQPAVDETGFGYIVIQGTRYDHDVVVYPDGTVERRPKRLSSGKKRVYGHTPLSVEEARYILSRAGNTDYILVGTGQYGALPIEEEAKELLEQYAPLIVEPTPKAVEAYNSLIKKGHRVLAIFHVTC